MKLQLSNGEVHIDDKDHELVSKYKWHINDSGYAVWRGVENGKKKTIRMHRLIMDPPKGLMIDHINHKRNDNRRGNLRICTQSENMRNKENQGKGYWYNKGKTDKPYVVEIYGIHRGCFATKKEAIQFADLVRKGLAYKKPRVERIECRYGHSLKDAYIYGGSKLCRVCQLNRSKEYYRRKHVRKTKY